MVITIDACTGSSSGRGIDQLYNTVHRTFGGIDDPESFICLTFVHDIRCNSKIPGDLVWTIMMHTLVKTIGINCSTIVSTGSKDISNPDNRLRRVHIVVLQSHHRDRFRQDPTDRDDRTS